jgi:hypothetical protein
MQASGPSIIVRTDDGIKMFSQGDIDKRGVKIMRGGRAATISDFRNGDRLTATIVTAKPPVVMTEQQVQATLASAGGAGSPASAAAGGVRRLPKTASARPALAAASALLIAIGLALTIRRRAAD